MDKIDKIGSVFPQKRVSRKHSKEDHDPKKEALRGLEHQMSTDAYRLSISFDQFLNEMLTKPQTVVRNVFQVFHDMIYAYVGEGLDESFDDPASINYLDYDTHKLFVEQSDTPFFADRLLANKLINLVEAWKRSTQQNKIYIFIGPPGCGKTAFLNNLLKKFEEYANVDAGMRYETVWRFDRKMLESLHALENMPVFEKLSRLLESELLDKKSPHETSPQESLQVNEAYIPANYPRGDFIEVPCPSHDNPILMIPKHYRLDFLYDLFKNTEFKWRLSTEREYAWIFKEMPCSICRSIYDALLDILQSPQKVLGVLYARPYRIARHLGQGISVFNPGDRPLKQNVLSDAIIQRFINGLVKDSNRVRYIFSQYAKTNNGIYALMDIKSHNTERLIELHNIISDGIHKVEDIEENVNSLLMAVMNPEDEKNIEGFQSFIDRVEFIKIPYVMDFFTEVEIYRNIFGLHIDERFLPRVLHYFARVIISSRLKVKSAALLEWIGNPKKYRQFCDDNLQLLKMEIYTGYIPGWLTEDDRRNLSKQQHLNIIAESENEGDQGISGRDSIKIFNEFFSAYSKDDHLINIIDVVKFFTNARKEIRDSIPDGFLDALIRMYDHTVVQEVQESLLYFNEEQLIRDIYNYLFALGSRIGSVERCLYTGDKLEISEKFLEIIEDKLLGPDLTDDSRLEFRGRFQSDYLRNTLSEGSRKETISETQAFKSIYEIYRNALGRTKLISAFENKEFLMAIVDYDNENFKIYEQEIRDDVVFLIVNLGRKYRYTEYGARQICLYINQNQLIQRFYGSGINRIK